MADQNVTQLTQILEAQLQASTLFYGVADPTGTPDDVKINAGSTITEYYKISPLISSGNLTLRILHLDGTNISSANPLAFKIGDSWRVALDNLPFTKNAATNWCNLGSAELAAKTHDLFVYVIYETGAAAGLKLGFSRIPYALTMGDFVNTTTSEKYIAGGWTNFTSTDVVRNIGRFAAQLSAGAGYTWSIPSAKVISYPFFESDWRTWQPVGTASGSMTYTITATDKAEYKMRMHSLEYELKVAGTTGGTASNTIISSSPFNSTNATHLLPRQAYFTDGGSVLSGIAYVGTSVIQVVKDDNSNFALGTGRYMASTGAYRIG
jgi:hypothetical protein